MKMQNAATRAGIGCDLDNYRSKRGSKPTAGEHKVAIRIVHNRVPGLVSGVIGNEP
jgi:hypothetical protein